MCCANPQDRARLETHVASKTIKPLIAAKTTNVFAATQQTSKDNEVKLHSKARQHGCLK